MPGVVETVVSSDQEVEDLMAKGSKNRAVGVHDMNAHSSRSHSIMCIKVHGENKHSGKVFNGKLHLIDLAVRRMYLRGRDVLGAQFETICVVLLQGSERVGKTGCSGNEPRVAVFNP